MQLNASRIKVLQAQDDIVNAMKDKAAKDLLNVSGNESAYKQLLKDLIVQVGTFNMLLASLKHRIMYTAFMSLMANLLSFPTVC